MIRSTLSVTKLTPLAAPAMSGAAHPLGAEVGAQILKRGRTMSLRRTLHA